MKRFSFSRKLTAAVCLAGCGVVLFSCSNMNNPIAVSAGLSNQQTASVSSPWSETDIGTTGATQSATPTKDMFIVYGAGADIFGTADAFHFVYRTLNGNGQLIMAPQSITNTNGWAKAGLMIRENLAPGSKNMLVAITPSNGVTSQYRNTTNGSTAWKGGAGEKVPYYLKIVRNGSSITTYKSANGTTWVTIETQTISMATSVYIGMAVCSHVTGTLCNANFKMLTPAVIVTQPRNNSACAGAIGGFAFVNDGGSYSYQWYFSLSASGPFVPISDGTNYSGATYFKLYITGVPGTTGTYGYYYCKINYLGMITQTNTVVFSQTSGC